jgi:hypothetical protein
MKNIKPLATRLCILLSFVLVLAAPFRWQP